MKKRLWLKQIVAVLKQAELGMPVADLIRQVGMSEQTFYRWKQQYAGMQSDQGRELKQLREENARLKKRVAGLNIAMLNGSFRGACVNWHGFESLEEAKAIGEAWCRDDNESRPHSTLNDLPPAEFARRSGLPGLAPV